ncbi:hypothetical protein CPB83DRAFT_853421 [Crepidotus variabilis]|uniref:Peregrin n=1 Tax=Crepidotus variabilis TaxID=179855 RepID=A0A9P6JPV6_9AGAR|nr:hypothetical protein CPB83DRAFT_853421 [Crepidotus variabilis]
MARGSTAQHGSPATSLPKVEYELAKDDVFKLPSGVHDNLFRVFGYNDFSGFQRPEYYIRHVEPLESDLAIMVEYDMDEQDQEWLDALNLERKKQQSDPVQYEAFEIIMDRLEKEWFDLTKNIPKPDFAMPSEDSTCAICDDSEGENSNAIVFCDGCNLAVHQDCYGVPYIPEGQWLCRKCTVSPENPVSCALCPMEGGAFKQTLDGIWVHLLCAIWIPETRVANEVFMEPITGLERISKGRWKLRCEVCGHKSTGACIQCTKPSCFSAFHTTCARKEKLLMPMKSAHGAAPASLTAYCEKHLPPEQQVIRSAALEAEDSTSNNFGTTKSARAYAKTYKPGPPLVPAIIVDRIVRYIAKLKIRKKAECIQLICRYWSLKREARRGAPLLKRLHLEPWTAGGSGKFLSEEEKTMKLDQLQRLRQDLVVLKDLTDLVKKRETRKLRQADVIYEVLSQGIFPHHGRFRVAFQKILVSDKNDVFKIPVSKYEVPDYYNVVQNPMCWDVIDAKLDNHQYWDLQDFVDDVNLVVDNAMLYNKKESPIFKLASTIKKTAKPILVSLEDLRFHHILPPPSPMSDDFYGDTVNNDDDTNPKPNDNPHLVQVTSKRGLLGDLEPYLDVIELLISSQAIRGDLNIELDDSQPITSLFNYEFAKMKPPPPESPGSERKVYSSTFATGVIEPGMASGVKKPSKRGKAKRRDRKAEAERAKRKREARESAAREAALANGDDETLFDNATAEDGAVGHTSDTTERRNEKQREREFQAALDASAGFRAPRTRGALAAVAAFEAEAGVDVDVHHPNVSDEEMDETKSTGKPSLRVTIMPSTSTPSHPRVVNTVDNRDSFNLFNAGWILPPDQKRGGRTPHSAIPLTQLTVQPPKKKQKTEQANPPLASASLDDRTSPEGDTSMDVDQAVGENHEGSRARALSNATEEIDVPHNVLTQPNGTIIIEKLDTPAIRRERSMRRKAERQRQNLSNGMASSEEVGPEAGPSTTRFGGEDLDEESELSELSDEDDEGEDDGAMNDASIHDAAESPHVPAPAEPKSRPSRKKPPKKQRTKFEEFEDATIVWAKSESYPWWPAVVYSESNAQVPKNIMEAHKQKKIRRKIKLFIVQYYDKQNSWQSVGRDKLLLLGDDEALDQEMLGTTPKQKWKASASRDDCRDAYRLALIDMQAAAETAASDAGV